MKAGAATYIVGGIGIAVVVSAIIGGLWLLGPPAQEREGRMDDRRVADLAAIGRVVDLYWSRNGNVPPNLDAIRQEAGPALSMDDPRTQQPYQYRVVGSDRYELCAEFQQDSSRLAVPAGDFWHHTVGRQCFILEARPISR